MPPSRVIWAGIYAFVTTLCTAVSALYTGASNVEIQAWIIALCGSIGVSFVAGKTTWNALRQEVPK